MNEQCLEERRRNEIFFLIARFLEESSCRRAAKVLIEELEEKELLFKGKKWSGEETKLTFEEISKRNVHISSDYLLLLCNELCSQLESSGSIRRGGGGGHSLIGNEISSFIYNNNNNKNNCKIINIIFGDCLFVKVTRLSSIPSMASLLIQPINFTKMKKHTVILGHLAPVFCLSFDSTGQRIITGADDDLAKIWCSRTGQLVTTLRGHHAEITDLSVSWDNTLIATGSLDKLVRVWCGHTSAPLAVLSGHSGHITSVQLSPSPDDDSKYIATTAKDGCLLFWKWDPTTLKF
uniref:BRWD/PHIP N-terminal domain-containing protein n=3 Tax=Amphimedon queenslandica TaxID=400682 RepID=A0A1X7T224_AMPQE